MSTTKQDNHLMVYNANSLTSLSSELATLDSNSESFPLSYKPSFKDPTVTYVSSHEFGGGLKSSKKTASSIFSSGEKYIKLANNALEQAHEKLKDAKENFDLAAQGIIKIDNKDQTSGKEITDGDHDNTAAGVSILSADGKYRYTAANDTAAVVTKGGVMSLVGTFTKTNVETGESETVSIDKNGVETVVTPGQSDGTTYNDANNDLAKEKIQAVHDEQAEWEQRQKVLEGQLERGEITQDDYDKELFAHYDKHNQLVDEIPGDVDPEKVAPITDDMTASQKMEALQDQYNVKLSKYHEGIRNNDWSLAEQNKTDAQTLETEQYKLLPDLAKEYDGKIADIKSNLADGKISEIDANEQMASLTQEFNDTKSSVETAYNVGTSHNESSGANLKYSVSKATVTNADGTTTTTFTDGSGKEIGSYSTSEISASNKTDIPTNGGVGDASTRSAVEGNDGNTYYETRTTTYDQNGNPTESVTYQDVSGNDISESEYNSLTSGTDTTAGVDTTSTSVDDSSSFVTGNDGSQYSSVDAEDNYYQSLQGNTGTGQDTSSTTEIGLDNQYSKTTVDSTDITGQNVSSTTGTQTNTNTGVDTVSLNENTGTSANSGKTVMSTEVTTNTTYSNGQKSTSVEEVLGDGRRMGTSSITSSPTGNVTNAKPTGIQKETVITYSDGTTETLHENTLIGNPPPTKTVVGTETNTNTIYSGSGTIPASVTKETKVQYSDGSVAGTMNKTINGVKAPKSNISNAAAGIGTATQNFSNTLKGMYHRVATNANTNLGNNTVKDSALIGAAAIPAAGITLNSIYRKKKDKKEEKSVKEESNLSFTPEDMDKLPDGNDYFKM